MIFPARIVDSAVSVSVFEVDVCSKREQVQHASEVTVARCKMESRPLVVISRANVNAARCNIHHTQIITGRSSEPEEGGVT
jgi:hypothetical protein